MPDPIDQLLYDPNDDAEATPALRSIDVPSTGDASADSSGDLGDRLLAEGAIDAAMLTSARSVLSRTPGLSLAEALLNAGAPEETVQQRVAEANGLEYEQIEYDRLEALKQLDALGSAYCSEHGVMPLRRAGSRMVVGMVQPEKISLIDELRHKLGAPIKPVVVCRADIDAAISAHKEETSDPGVEVDDIIGDINEDDVEVVETEDEDLDLEKMAGESPVIRFVNYLIFNAVKEGASDIHIEPQEKALQIRFRIDGVLFDSMRPPHQMHAAIVSRLKIMANLDISERRLPQDGRIRAMVHGRKLDLRLSTLPTAAGEKVVLRILDTRSIQVDLDDLGFGPDALTIWKNQ
ncbi:MAG: ATPase, T2SS/T4P/T4SS family, partial [Planctomycetota bacterium]